MAKKGKSKVTHSRYPIPIWILWLLLICASIYWAQERLLYQDSAFAVFRICNLDYSIDHNRWGNVLLIGPAMLCVKAGLGLISVITALSITGIFIPLLCSWLIYKLLPSIYLYLLPALLLVATGSEWFFLGIAEMLPALCYGSLALAFMIKSTGIKSAWYWLSVAFMLLAFYTHPGSLPFLVFIPIIFYAKSNQIDGFFSLGIMAIVAIVKVFFTENSTYESGIFDGLQWDKITGFFGLWSLQFFKSHFSSLFLLPIAIFVVGLLLTMGSLPLKHWIFMFGGAFLGLLLVLVVFGEGDSDLMMEKNFAPVIALMLSPLLMVAADDAMQSRFLWVCFTALLVSGSVQRYQASLFYTQRLEKLDDLIKKIDDQGIEKAYISADSLSEPNWRVTWALPYESILRSEIQLNKSITIKPADSMAIITGKNPGLFLGATFAYPIHSDTMNKRYFHLSKEAIYKEPKYLYKQK